MVKSQIQVDLQFNARTERARQQLNELQTNLTKLSTIGAGTQFGMTSQIKEATQSAMNLQTALQKATNVNTGQLNLNKFQAELNRSGMTLQQYAQKLQALGPQGAQAFSQLAIAVNQASTKMFSLSAGAKSMMDTLFSSVKWSLAYGAINMVTQAISETVNYAKELDAALTDIRVVTGYSTQYMKNFADEASRAAKELKTTTTEYAKGALIYYQQGLSAAEVRERTDTTIKLANVLGESTSTVSDWMTAIWNNFDDGSKSLEYYADVLAKLGAATASSADEIAGGLEKFAAVAEAIGLSYEYAASMLTTITAETRQSEEVVGTALKTILSRMEGLNLGETLDDGTTLNKYSSALLTVGVNIKNANNELKDMDQILAETGERWKTLDRDQQVALAQTVAGVRQYTQFIALMDNWDVMEENLEMAKDATGELNKQYQIYEGSVAASEKRVKESLNSIKASFLGTDDLAKMNNTLSDALEIVADLLKSFGGLKTVLLMAAAAMTKLYQPQIAGFFNQAAVSIQNLKLEFQAAGTSIKNAFKGVSTPTEGAFGSFQSDTAVTAKQMLQEASRQHYGGYDSRSTELAQKEVDISKQLVTYSDRLSEADAARLSQESAILSKKNEIIRAQEEELKNESEILAQKFDSQGGTETQKVSEQVGLAEGNLNLLKSQSSVAANTGLQGEELKKYASSSQGYLNEVKLAINNLGDEFSSAFVGDLDAAEKAIGDMTNDGINRFNELDKIIDKIRNKMADMGTVAIKGAAESDALNDIPEIGTDLNNVESPEQILQTTKEIQAHPQAQEFIGQDNMNLLTDYSQQAQELSEYNALCEQQIQTTQDEKKAYLEKNNLIEQEGRLYSKTSKGKKVMITQDSAHDKVVKKYNKTIDDNNNQLSDSRKKMKTLGSQVQKITRVFNTNTKNTAKNSKEFKKNTAELEANGKANRKNAADMVTNKQQADDLIDSYDGLSNGIHDAAFSTKHWSDSLAGGISTFTNAAMGLSMLTSGIEGMVDAFKDGDFSLSSFLTSLMSIGFGIGTLLPLVSKIGVLTQNVFIKQKMKEIMLTESSIDWKNKETRVKLKNTVQEILALKAQGKTEELETMKSKANSLTKIAFKIAEQVSAGPEEWGAAAVSAAAVAAIIGTAIGVGVSKSNANKKEAKKESLSKSVEKGQEALESFDEIEEESQAVRSLADEYKRLSISGQNAYDTMKQLQEQVPELIEKYKELEENTDINFNTVALEEALEAFNKTGDMASFSALDAYLKEAEDKVAEAELETSQRVAQDATQLAVMTAGDGNKNKGKMVKGDLHIRVGGQESGLFNKKNVKARKILVAEMGDNVEEDGRKLIFKTGSPAEIQETYEKMGKALAELQDQGLDGTKLYKRVNQNYQELGDNMDAITEASDAMVVAAAEDWNLGKSDKATNVEKRLQNAGIDLDNISVEEYRKQREEILKTLAEEYQITQEQAEELLAKNERTKSLEVGFEIFADDGRIAYQLKNKANLTLLEVQAWYDTLSEEEKTLFMTIDFSQAETIEDAKEQLAHAKEMAEQQKILTQAEDLDIDLNTFEAYTDLLVETNQELEENNALSKQIALNNLKINKGISSLISSWKDLSKVLAAGNRESFEYAEALGKIKTALEEAFDYSPSTKMIEANLELIERMAEGDTEALDELQDKMAEDYVYNIDYKTAINGESESLFSIQDTIFGFLDQLNEFDDIEIGAEVTLNNEEYLNQLQDLLDNGQLTQDELQKIMRMKGYEMEITGWKEVDGPKTTTTQYIYHNGEAVASETKVIESSDKIKVPIINGDTSGIDAKSITGDASKPAAIRRSNTADSLDTTTMEEAGKKDTKKYEDEIEEYHDIERAIEDVNKQLELLGEQKDRAFGANRISLMNKEIAKQKELIELEKQHLQQIEAKLQAEAAYLNYYGAQYNAMGQLTNYEEMMRKQVDLLNSEAITEDQFNEFKNHISAYEEALDSYKETQVEIINMENEIFDKEVEKVNYQIEFKIEIADDGIALIEYQLEGLNDTIADTVQAIDLIGQQTEINLRKLDIYSQGIKDMLSLSGFSDNEITSLLSGDMSVLKDKELTEEQISSLTEYKDALMEATTAIRESFDTLEEEIVGAFDKMNEDMDQQIANIDHLTSVAQGYKDIIDLVGKDTLGVSNTILKDLNQAVVKTSQDGLKATKAKLEADKSALQDAEEALSKARERNAKEDIEMWENVVKTLSETVTSGEEDLMSRWSEALQNGADAFTGAVEQIMETFEKAVTGVAGSFDALQQKYDQQSESTKRYLDDYTKIYELSKINRDIEKTINQKDNISAQNRLRDIQEEVNELQGSNTEMSKYELDLLKAKYDLRLAEIALEEAQEAKKQVRMQRDSEGNWGYVYTADQNQIDTAQQQYEDKLYAMQNLIQTTASNLQGELIQLPQSMMEAISAITEDFTLSQEEREERIAEIYEFYKEKQDYLIKEYEKLNEDSKTLYEKDWKNYSDSTGYKISEAEDWVDCFEESIYAQITGYDDLEEVQESFASAVEDMLETLSEEYNIWYENVNAANEAAGVSTQAFAETVGQECDNIVEDSGIAAEAVQAIATAGEEGFSGLVDAADTYCEEYSKLLDEYTTKTEDITTAITNLKKEYESLVTAVSQELTIPPINDQTTAPDTAGEGNGKVTNVDGGGTTSPFTIKGQNDDVSTAGVETIDSGHLAKSSYNATNNTLQVKKAENGYYSIETEKGYGGSDGKVYLTEEELNRLKTDHGVTISYDKQANSVETPEPKKADDNDPPYEKDDIVETTNATIISEYPHAEHPNFYNAQKVQAGAKFHILSNSTWTNSSKKVDKHGVQVPQNSIWVKVGSRTFDIANRINDAYIPQSALKRISSYDTGGYTGSWDSSGRLAMLHQKEIVLNADDTANFLTAIDILRDITKTIDLNAMQQQLNLQALTAMTIGTNSSSIEQQVTIHAEFPNATNHTEIEQAFDTLINRASQYAFRT